VNRLREPQEFARKLVDGLLKRRVDQVNAIAQLLKAQAQLLSYLPVNDESWQTWLNGLSFDVKPLASK